MEWCIFFKHKPLNQKLSCRSWWFRLRLDSLKLRLRLRLVLFFFLFSRVLEECGYCSLNSSRKCWLFHHEQCICVLFTDPLIPLFSNFFIKNGSYGTIYTFKNYFATVFLVFSFQFQQNKFYPNRHLVIKSTTQLLDGPRVFMWFCKIFH